MAFLYLLDGVLLVKVGEVSSSWLAEALLVEASIKDVQLACGILRPSSDPLLSIPLLAYVYT